MKQTVNLSQFRDAFNRMDRGNQFSYEALEILFNGLEEFEEDTGEEMELDVIELCCDFSEMTARQIQDTYPTLCEELEDDEKLTVDKAVEILGNETWVLGSTDGGTIVFRQF